MAGLSNWEKLKAKLPGETLRYRDVYADQQLDRTNMPQMKNMTSRKIATIAMSVFVFFVAYIILSVVQGYSKMVHTGQPAYLLQCFGLTFGKLFFTIVITIIFYAIMYRIMEHNLAAQNAMADNADINQYQNDQHIALPEEIQMKFDWFPDVGATSDVQFSSMISHMAISNKGLKTVPVAKRAEADILDEDGDVILYKGEVLTDDDGNIIFEEKPLIDTDFMDALYDASGVPKGKLQGEKIRKYYNTTMIPYNPDGSDREKLGKYATVADLINADWELPYYEPQRPAGAYIVDTAPVNTMVLAIKSCMA